MKLDPNAPAWPTPGQVDFSEEGKPRSPIQGYGWVRDPEPGLTIRGELAARAMQGFIASGRDISKEAMYHDAIFAADALIAELNREAKP